MINPVPTFVETSLISSALGDKEKLARWFNLKTIGAGEEVLNLLYTLGSFELAASNAKEVVYPRK